MNVIDANLDDEFKIAIELNAEEAMFLAKLIGGCVTPDLNVTQLCRGMYRPLYESLRDKQNLLPEVEPNMRDVHIVDYDLNF